MNTNKKAAVEAQIHLLRDELGCIAAGAETERHPVEIWGELCDERHRLRELEDNGSGLVVYDRGAWMSHAAGWLLHVEWAIESQSYVEWYASRQAAIAALLRLAEDNGRLPNGQGTRVDLTAVGCQPSQAWVSKTEARYHDA